MGKKINWQAAFAPTHLQYNIKSWNLGKTLYTIASLASIAFFQFTNNFSLEFKMVLNILWFPFFQIGLTYSCFLVGFEYYTDRPIKWTAWMRMHAGFYKTYYFWAIITIACALIALGILQSAQDTSVLDSFKARDPGVVPWDGYSTNPNAWYGLMVLYSLVPLQNYYIVGTSMIAAWFWFIFVAPFFYNWMNRVKFSTCTFWMVVGLIIALFFSGWTDFVWTGPTEITQSNPAAWDGIGNYTTWYLIIYMMLAGFYIRKYTRVIPWRKALLWFVIIAVVCIVLESIMDVFGAYGQLHIYKHSEGYNNFFIGASFCSLPIMVLSWLAINVFAQWTPKHHKPPSPAIVAWNRFNDYGQKYLGDLFALIGLGTKAVFGMLILRIGLGMDIRVFNSLRLMVGDGTQGTLISTQAWGWLLLGWSILWSAAIMGLGNVRMQLFKVFGCWYEKWHTRHTIAHRLKQHQRAVKRDRVVTY